MTTPALFFCRLWSNHCFSLMTKHMLVTSLHVALIQALRRLNHLEHISQNISHHLLLSFITRSANSTLTASWKVSTQSIIGVQPTLRLPIVWRCSNALTAEMGDKGNHMARKAKNTPGLDLDRKNVPAFPSPAVNAISRKSSQNHLYDFILLWSEESHYGILPKMCMLTWILWMGILNDFFLGWIYKLQ